MVQIEEDDDWNTTDELANDDDSSRLIPSCSYVPMSLQIEDNSLFSIDDHVF